jgi:hypothetical protein
MPPNYPQLISLLETRLRVIADHVWRDTDAAGHLEALKTASTALLAWQETNASHLPEPLGHFMQSQSYQKALATARVLAK